MGIFNDLASANALRSKASAGFHEGLHLKKIEFIELHFQALDPAAFLVFLAFHEQLPKALHLARFLASAILSLAAHRQRSRRAVAGAHGFSILLVNLIRSLQIFDLLCQIVDLGIAGFHVIELLGGQVVAVLTIHLGRSLRKDLRQFGALCVQFFKQLFPVHDLFPF